MGHEQLFGENFSSLRNVLGLLAAANTVNSVADLILDLAVKYTGAQRGSVMLASEYGELEIIASTETCCDGSSSYKARVGEGIAGAIAQDGIPVRVEDIRVNATFKRNEADASDSHFSISCPILGRKRPLGLINVSEKQDNKPFTADEFELMRIIASCAALSLENALLKDRLKARAAYLKEMNGKHDNCYPLNSDFLNRVSHELRSPLNSINGIIYYLNTCINSPDSPTKEFLDIAAVESARLVSSIEYLLDYLWLNDENRRIRRSVVDLTTLLREVGYSTPLKDSLERKSIELTIDVSEGTSVVGDKTQLFQFFTGMITGLSHYLNENNSIRVTLTRDDPVKVNIALSICLPDILVSSLFSWRRMFETDRSPETARLYLAWRIAKTHGWTITTANSEDAFLVTITIPYKAAQ